MCGFVIFINCGNESELLHATNEIQHRGPDDSETRWFADHNSGLGHNRLAIIDLSPKAHQPMLNKETRDWIIYNGEIYNFREIKNELLKLDFVFYSDSDTEVILKAYQRWGKSCLDKLNGMFSFVIYNEINKNIFAARDRLGIKPFYYYFKKSQLIIASEIKSILKCSDYAPEPDYYALYTPVHYQPAPYTGFKEIYKLKPGHFLEFIEGNLKIEPYWRITPSEIEVNPFDAIEELDFLLNDSVKLQMISDVPVGSLLSGGLDSSIICALMQRLTNHQASTFTIKFEFSDLKKQGNVDDSYFASKVAKHFDFDHSEIILKPDIINLIFKMVWHLDEPLSDPSAISTYLISKAARDRGIVVLLNGMGGDEVFAGYRKQLACLKAEQYQRILPFFIQKTLKNVFSLIPESTSKRSFRYIRWIKQFSKFGSLPQFERFISSSNSAINSEIYNNFFTDPPEYEKTYLYSQAIEQFQTYNLSYLTKMCLNDCLIYLPNHNLNYSDKASMAASVESRPPLVDHRIVEFMFSLKPELRIKGNIQKFLLKKAAEKYLPKEIVYRPKAPFSVPLRGWIKNELDEMVCDLLSFDSIKKRGLHNPELIQKIIHDNKKGLHDYSQIIFRLMISEIWFKTFFS
ncbi:Asparagine synthetase [glutamine-hydrolyzing] (EC [Olavius sp. associated proteobacterium Delta 1]|nr:Asparagine synthetase [glutamine-hydrolyzing] (EC [Olavius sp. associated proteobacterium Delta 1]